MRRLRIPDDVAALIRGLHPTLKRKVRDALEDILEEPGIGKQLRDEPGGLRSHRIGRFPVIYRAGARGVVEVVAVGPRASIYIETLRILQREDRRS